MTAPMLVLLLLLILGWILAAIFSTEYIWLRDSCRSLEATNKMLADENKRLEAYNKKLLANQIQQNNQGCRVNPGNPNIVNRPNS